MPAHFVMGARVRARCASQGSADAWVILWVGVRRLYNLLQLRTFQLQKADTLRHKCGPLRLRHRIPRRHQPLTRNHFRSESSAAATTQTLTSALPRKLPRGLPTWAAAVGHVGLKHRKEREVKITRERKSRKQALRGASESARSPLTVRSFVQ
jgi:hypothetical protein